MKAKHLQLNSNTLSYYPWDVSTFTFATWVLSGGKGGLASSYGVPEYGGGGGGGLLVNGEGPTASQYQGAGYGGGGNGYSDFEEGLSGLILLEIN